MCQSKYNVTVETLFLQRFAVQCIFILLNNIPLKTLTLGVPDSVTEMYL